MRHPCETGHDHAEGYSAREADTGRLGGVGMSCVFCGIFLSFFFVFCVEEREEEGRRDGSLRGVLYACSMNFFFFFNAGFGEEGEGWFWSVCAVGEAEVVICRKSQRVVLVAKGSWGGIALDC